MDKHITDSEVSSHSLRSSVTEIMQQYFANLKGEEPRNVYDFFLDEIEPTAVLCQVFAVVFVDNILFHIDQSK